MSAAAPSRAPAGGAPAAAPGGPPLWAVVLAGILLTGLFIVLGFPYDRLAARLERSVERATGAQVEIGDLGPGLGLGGPRLVAREVHVVLPDGARLALERVWARPAWSLSWLRLRPAVRLGARSELGRVDGTLTLGGAPHFAGTLIGLDLQRLPVDTDAGALSLEGTVDLELDVTRGERGWTGTAHIEAEDGTAALPGLPVAVPYETLRGDLRLDDDGGVTVESLTLDGPMVALTLSGRVGSAPDWARAPVRLTGRLEARDESVRGMLTSQGIALGPDGAREVRISGTLAAPVIR